MSGAMAFVNVFGLPDRDHGRDGCGGLSTGGPRAPDAVPTTRLAVAGAWEGPVGNPGWDRGHSALPGVGSPAYTAPALRSDGPSKSRR